MKTQYGQKFVFSTFYIGTPNSTDQSETKKIKEIIIKSWIFMDLYYNGIENKKGECYA